MFLTSSLASNTVQAKAWKGAEIITNEEFKYGAFEARIRGPKGSGYVVPFFLWKYDSELSGTEWQEQDFEIFGADGQFQTQLMTPGNPRTENKVKHIVLPYPAWEKYYTYRMEWTPEYLAFYIDGVIIRRETNANRYSKFLDESRAEPAELRISLWAGNYDFTGFFDQDSAPGATFVEFVKTYTYNHETKDFDLNWVDEFDYIDNSRWYFANWTFNVAINDYVADNAAAIDGKLVIAFTSEENQGVFPTNIPPDNEIIGIEEVDIIEETNPLLTNNNIPAYEIPSEFNSLEFHRSLDDETYNKGNLECGSGPTDAGKIGNECYVGWLTPTEWLEYTITPDLPGVYNFSFEVATQATNRYFTASLNDELIQSKIEVNSLGWTTFSNSTISTYLADESTLSLGFPTGAVNLKNISVNYSPTQFIPYTSETLQAEFYHNSKDNTVGNNGEQCGSSGNADTVMTDETCFVSIEENESIGFIIQNDLGDIKSIELLLQNLSDIPTIYSIKINGETVLSNISFSEKQFTSSIHEIDLPDSIFSMDIEVTAGILGIDSFQYLDYLPSDAPDSAISVPALIEAEDFDAYYDTTINNLGSSTCRTGSVDAQLTTDSAGGFCNIGWTKAGEWLEYNINVQQEGYFVITLRLASASVSQQVSVLVDGELIDTVTSPNIGWQSFADRNISTKLTHGNHTLRIYFEDGNSNFNYILITENTDAITPDPVEPEPSDPPTSCNWYGTPTPMCMSQDTGWGYENGQSCVSTGVCYSDAHIEWHELYGTHP
ncbi:family 16 glycosylhydrolase [Paraglaciecola sp. 2405UD69-4]